MEYDDMINEKRAFIESGIKGLMYEKDELLKEEEYLKEVILYKINKHESQTIHKDLAELTKVQDRIEEIDASIKELKEKKEKETSPHELAKEIDEITSEIQELKKQKKELEANGKSAKKDIDKIKTQINALEKEQGILIKKGEELLGDNPYAKNDDEKDDLEVLFEEREYSKEKLNKKITDKNKLIRKRNVLRKNDPEDEQIGELNEKINNIIVEEKDLQGLIGYYEIQIEDLCQEPLFVQDTDINGISYELNLAMSREGMLKEYKAKLGNDQIDEIKKIDSYINSIEEKKAILLDMAEDAPAKFQEMEQKRKKQAEIDAKKAEQEAEMKQREMKIANKEKELLEREKKLKEKEEKIAKREKKVEKKENEISYKEAQLTKKEEELKTREEEMDTREADFMDRVVSVTTREEDLKIREEEFDKKQSDLEKKMEEIKELQERFEKTIAEMNSGQLNKPVPTNADDTAIGKGKKIGLFKIIWHDIREFFNNKFHKKAKNSVPENSNIGNENTISSGTSQDPVYNFNPENLYDDQDQNLQGDTGIDQGNEPDDEDERE